MPKIIENGGHLKSNGKQVSDFHEYEYVVERSSASMFQSSGHSDLAGQRIVQSKSICLTGRYIFCQYMFGTVYL